MTSKKDTFYFSHDATAKDDPKCMILIDQLGLEGYGIFWVLVETLRTQPNYKCPIAIIPSLARRYNTTAEKMMAVVKSYSLFEIENEELFFSDSLNRRMAISDAKRLKLSEAGKRGNLIKYGKSSPPDHNPITTQSQLNKKKVNKSKEFIAPTLEEFTNYFLENGYPKELAGRAWNGYASANWHDTKGNKINSWKQKAQFNWFRPDNKIKVESLTTNTVEL